MLPTTGILGIALAASLVFGGVQTVRHARAQAAVARVELQSAQREADMQSRLTAQVEANREMETRWQGQQKEALNAAQKSTDQARADADAARGAVDRLRQRATAAAGGCQAPGGTGTAGTGAPAEPPGVVCADLLVRLGEAGQQLAAFADRAVIAGQACESAWPSSSSEPGSRSQDAQPH